jgi:hypothetical protein
MRLPVIVFVISYTFSFTSVFTYFRSTQLVSPISKGKVLAYNSESKITPSPTPSNTPIPKPTNTPSPTEVPPVTPTQTSSLQPQYSQQDVHEFIERFAGQYGIDPNVLRHIAVCESGFNPLAVNGPYAGLFQFSENAWVNNRMQMGEDTDPALRLNAEEASQTAAYLISIGKSYLWPNCIP